MGVDSGFVLKHRWSSKIGVEEIDSPVRAFAAHVGGIIHDESLNGPLVITVEVRSRNWATSVKSLSPAALAR
jgi:hypothetical protein